MVSDSAAGPETWEYGYILNIVGDTIRYTVLNSALQKAKRKLTWLVYLLHVKMLLRPLHLWRVPYLGNAASRYALRHSRILGNLRFELMTGRSQTRCSRVANNQRGHFHVQFFLQSVLRSSWKGRNLRSSCRTDLTFEIYGYRFLLSRQRTIVKPQRGH